MSNQNNFCFYHTKTIASSECYRCHRPICSQDTSQYEDNHGDYMMIRAYCTPCFKVRTVQENRPYTDIAAFIFLILWSILVLWIFFPLIIFSYFIYRFINNNRKNKRKKLDASQKEYEKFLSTLPDELQEKYAEEIVIFCNQCSTLLLASERFCPTCTENEQDKIEVEI